MSQSSSVSSSSSAQPSVLPAWAAVADATAVALLIVAAIVAEWGGFRVWIDGTRIALTSPYRVIATAVLLLAVRHFIVRHPAIHIDFPQRLRRALRTASARAALVAVGGTRPAILFVAYFALASFGYVHEQPPVRFSEDELVNLQ